MSNAQDARGLIKLTDGPRWVVLVNGELVGDGYGDIVELVGEGWIGGDVVWSGRRVGVWRFVVWV